MHITPIRPFPIRPVNVRLLTAFMLGLAMGQLCYLYLLIETGHQGADFTWPWRGAAELLAGRNPYIDPRLGLNNPYPYNSGLYYPLPALILVMPLTVFSASFAAAIFGGVSSGLLAWQLLHDDPRRLWLFLSFPFVACLLQGQWAILIAAAVLTPALNGLLLCKPSLGVPLLLALRGRYGWWSVGAVTFLSAITWPWWGPFWLESIQVATQRPIPLAVLPFGPFLALALLRWKDRRAWILFSMATAPQFVYDALPVALAQPSGRWTPLWAVLSWTYVPLVVLLPAWDLSLQVVIWYGLPLVTVLLSRQEAPVVKPTFFSYLQNDETK